MSVSDELAGRLAAQLGKNEHSAEGVASGDWQRCYRLLILAALNDVPRRRLPRDLAAVGIIVEAAELLAWPLFVGCGNQDRKAFAGRGIDDLLEWLYRCYGLFSHVAEVHSDLPKGRNGAEFEGMCRHTASEIRYLSRQLHDGLQEMGEHDEEHDDGGPATCPQCQQVTDGEGNPIRPFIVSGENFAHISSRLYQLIAEWLPEDACRQFMDRVTEGNRELVHSRALTSADASAVGT